MSSMWESTEKQMANCAVMWIFESVEPVASAITPVPGGVGPYDHCHAHEQLCRSERNSGSMKLFFVSLGCDKNLVDSEKCWHCWLNRI